MSETRQLLLIGLDAADPVLIDRWIDDGTLPNLGALKRAGTFGRLTTSARYLAGSPWTTFFTGQPPCHHGVYHDFQWRHERMEFARIDADWLPVCPFWRQLDRDVIAVVYDVPMTPQCEPFGGVEISGWASHDKLALHDSHPPELLADIKQRFGEWPIGPEAYGPTSLHSLLELRQHLLENTRRSTELALWLLQRPWNLAIVVFSALHRGGHRLWDRSSVNGPVSGDAGVVFDRALRDLYVACDDAVGELVAATPRATTIVFSLHGMMTNISRVDLLDEMLARILGADDNADRKPGLFRRMGEALPIRCRRFITSQVPRQLRNSLMTMWMTGGIDWHETEAFTLRADLQGYIRINLKGREPKGIVPPGSAYDRLCDRIADGLFSFRDASTGETFIGDVCRTDRLYPEGMRRDRLPDLIVLWKAAPGAVHEAVESPYFGRIQRATPGRIPNGRSGNHRPEGFLIARGQGIAAGAQIQNGADILDLAPTVVHMLGTQTSVALGGKIIPELALNV